MGQVERLREVAKHVRVASFLSCRDFLKAVYQGAKAAFEPYSYLHFADHLGFSKTNVIRLVVAGKRPLTVKAAERIAEALALKGSDRKYWLRLVAYEKERAPAARERLFKSLLEAKSSAEPSGLTSDELEYYSQWYHPIIREVLTMPAWDGSPEWIQAKLQFPLRLDEIRKALEVLAKLRLIIYKPELARFVASEQNLMTGREVDDIAIVRYHHGMIDLAKESITRIVESERDIQALTVSLPVSAVPILKAKIQQWVHDVMSMEQPGATGQDVFQLNVQLFPVTKTY